MIVSITVTVAVAATATAWGEAFFCKAPGDVLGCPNSAWMILCKSLDLL